MTVDDAYIADLKKLNHEVLMVFREMVRRDKAEACLRLGLEKGAADALETVTLDDLEKIADTGVFLFKARFGETRFWEDIVHAAREGDDNALNVARLQASIYATQSTR